MQEQRDKVLNKIRGKKKMEKRDGMIEGKESNWQLILKEIKKLTFAF